MIVAVSIGSQFPDLVDKPLAWGVDILINGRMFMHSLVFALPISIVVVVLSIRNDHTTAGAAFAFGYIVHIAGDFYPAFIGPEQYTPSNMLWPLLPPRPITKPDFIANSSAIPLSAMDSVLVCVAVLLCVYVSFSFCSQILTKTAQ
jgi:membrane-bound metal-dependent hydrolase YbcI (DUF457 family)